MSAQAFPWVGEKSRPLKVTRPCECGCDERGGEKGVGYLSGSTKEGHGFTLWIQDEETYQAVRAVLAQR
jgi:hypothetical protein